MIMLLLLGGKMALLSQLGTRACKMASCRL